MSIEQALAERGQRITRLSQVLEGLPLSRGPLTLEIGCGHGHFLTAYALHHPEVFCVAIDLIADRLERAGRKSSRAGIKTISWIKADAAELLDAWPAGVSITRHIFILFPDPWPKRRHWKNRLIQPDFLSRLAAISAPGVGLCFRTDHAPYYDAAVAVIRQHPDWELLDAANWPFEERTVFQQRAPEYHSAVARRRPRGD